MRNPPNLALKRKAIYPIRWWKETVAATDRAAQPVKSKRILEAFLTIIIISRSSFEPPNPRVEPKKAVLSEQLISPFPYGLTQLIQHFNFIEMPVLVSEPLPMAVGKDSSSVCLRDAQDSIQIGLRSAQWLGPKKSQSWKGQGYEDD